MYSITEALLVHLHATREIDETNVVQQLRTAKQLVADYQEIAVTSIDFERLRDEEWVDSLLRNVFEAPNFTHNADDTFATKLRAYQITNVTTTKRSFDFGVLTVIATDDHAARLIFESMKDMGIIE